MLRLMVLPLGVEKIKMHSIKKAIHSKHRVQLTSNCCEVTFKERCQWDQVGVLI